MSQRYTLVCGGLRNVLATIPDNSFDGMLCDPPYGFRFMNKSWDYDVPSVEDWAACFRVLKPGAPLLAFGGARTFHRITHAYPVDTQAGRGYSLGMKRAGVADTTRPMARD